MKYLKKYISLLTIMTLLLGVLPGCGGDRKAQSEEKHETPAEEVAVEEHEVVADPVVAPTPAVFFGVEANTVIPQWDEFVFEQNPVAAAAAYVDLLQNAFGFTVTEQSADDRSGRWSLQYGDRENAGLDVSSVFTQAEKYVVTVIYSQSIRWQDGAVYEWPAAESAFAPDPEFYFGIAAAGKDDNSMTLVLSGAPGVAVYEYLSILKNVYGLTEVDSYSETETWQWRMQKGGDETATVSIGLDKRGDGDWDLSFIFGENVTLVQAETRNSDETEEAEEITQVSSPVENDPSVLPDFMEHNAAAGFRQGTTSSDNVVVFLSEEDSVWDIAEAYVQLLLDMGYRISDTEEKTNQFMDVYRWYLTHDDVGGSTVKDSAQVCVKHMISIPYKSDDPHSEVSITFGSGVVYAGDSRIGSGSSGSSSSGDTFTPEFAKLDCLKCRGDGDCNTCNGYGEVRKYAGAGETVRAKCNTCRGSGKCTACDGSGKR